MFSMLSIPAPLAVWAKPAIVDPSIVTIKMNGFTTPPSTLSYSIFGFSSRHRFSFVTRLARSSGRSGKAGHPVAGDVLAAAYPHLGVPADVLDEADQRLRPAGMPRQPHMQPHRHHARALRTLFVEDIEAVAQKGEEILAGTENAAAEFRIVGRQRIRHNEVWPVTHPHPIGQLVVVGIAVIEEPAMLDQEAAGIFGRCVAAIPAGRGFASRPADQIDGLRNLPSFLGLREAWVVDPAIAVAADVPAARGDRRGGGRVRLEGLGAAENRYRHRKAGEDPMQPPEAYTGAIFEHALGAEIATCHAQIRAQHLGQSALGNTVSRRIGELRAFLEIDHEIDGDAGVARPLGVRRLGTVADEIPCHSFSPGRSGYQSSRQISSSE